jgi:hypothetical protein
MIPISIRTSRIGSVRHFDLTLHDLEELKRKRSEDLRKKNKSKMNGSLNSSVDSLGDLQEP